MGTNYYLHPKPDCGCCGRPFEPLHIGKSSGGWCFGLHVIPEEGINTLADWRARWAVPGSVIRDEYGEAITPAEMADRIMKRGRADGRPLSPQWFSANQAEPGPDGLARHRIDGRHCLGHGEGTWDYIAGWFS